MTNATLQEVIQEGRIQDLSVSAAFRQPDRVRHFLKNHPVLVDLLPEAFEKARQIFGIETPIELEVISDPEGIGPETLFAYIVTSLPTDDALSLMDRLDDQWYLSQPLEILEVFNFNLHFI